MGALQKNGEVAKLLQEYESQLSLLIHERLAEVGYTLKPDFSISFATLPNGDIVLARPEAKPVRIRIEEL